MNESEHLRDYVCATDAAIETFRASRDVYRDPYNEAKVENNKLKAENAKLRELVREMYATVSDHNSWWDCTYKDTTRFADRMHELGIEV